MEITETKALIPEIDRDYLTAKQYKYDIAVVDGWVNLIIHEYLLPAAYTPRVVDLLIRLPPGYPNSHPDMFWTSPDVRLVSGNNWPMRADVPEQYAGRSWQRWSRHFSGEWRPGIDNLRTYLASIRRELEKGL